MAISQTPIQGPSIVPPSPNRLLSDLIATLDADTTLTFAHGLAPGLALTPQDFAITPFGPDSAAGRISLWGVDAVDAVNVTISKAITVGSGAVGVQARLVLKTPHTVNG